MPIISQIELMSKEDILKVIRKQKCPKLKLIRHEKLSREELINALQECNCPIVKKLIEQMIFS